MSVLDRNFSKNNILIYCIHHAITSSSDGYAVRGHAISFALFQAGIAIKVLVAPSAHTKNLPFFKNIDGVDYMHLRENSVNSYLEVFRVFKPDAVLVASNWRHAQPVQAATEIFGVPFWYEARGFWERRMCQILHLLRQLIFYRRWTVISIASRWNVFTLNRHMADEWIDTWCFCLKISQMCNSAVTEPELGLSENLGLEGEKSSLTLAHFRLMNLDDLIMAFAKVRHQGLNARLLLLDLFRAENQYTMSKCRTVEKPCPTTRSSRLFSRDGRVPPHADTDLPSD